METLSLFGLFLAVVSSVWYLWTVIFGKTLPHPITFVVLALVGVLGFGSSWHGGAGMGAYVALVFLVLQVLVALYAGFFYLATWLGKSTKYDQKEQLVKWREVVVGLVGCGVIVAWHFASLGTQWVALASVLTDTFAISFTVLKIRRDPESEALGPWALDIAASGFGALGIATLSFTAAAYPIYLIFGNAAIAASIILVRKKRKQPVTASSTLQRTAGAGI